MTADAALLDHTAPNPPRYRVLRRLCKTILLGIILVAILFFIWRYEAYRRFDAEIAKALAEDKPVPVVPDHLNAASYLVLANAAVPPSNMGMPLTSTMVASLRGTQRAPSTAPALARTARFQPYLIWAPSAPAAAAAHELSVLSHELGAVAVHHHANGMDAEAIETLLDIVAATGRRGAPSPGAQDLDASIGRIMRTANEAIYVIAPDLQILPDSDATTRPNGPASRAQVKSLIDALLDDSTFERPFAERLRATRAYGAKYFAATPPISPMRVGAFLFDPFYRLESVRVLQIFDEVADAVTVSKHHEFLKDARNRRLPSQGSPLASIVHPFGRSIHAHTFSMHYEGLADRRISALLLAIRLYMWDHQEQLPPTLDALVPTYLSALPDDPFANSKQTFLYTRGAWPALASVGYDGQDDKTIMARRPFYAVPGVTSLFNDDRWSTKDAIYLLPFKPAAGATKD